MKKKRKYHFNVLFSKNPEMFVDAERRVVRTAVNIVSTLPKNNVNDMNNYK